jgi:Protein of unknown function, DUF481
MYTNSIKLNPRISIAGALLITAAFAGQSTTRAADAPKGWESVAAAGATLTRGNSQNFLATASFDTVRKLTADELRFGIGGGYGKTTRTPGAPNTDLKTADYLKGYGQWNHLFSERLYSGVRLSVDHDDISDLNYRVTLSPLAGYYIIKKPNTLLSVEAGPSLITEKQGGVDKTYMAARVAEHYEYKFWTDAKIWQSAEWLPQVDDIDNWILNFEAGVSAPIAKGFEVRLLLQDNYDNIPAAGRLKNDLKVVAGVGYKF